MYQFILVPTLYVLISFNYLYSPLIQYNYYYTTTFISIRIIPTLYTNPLLITTSYITTIDPYIAMIYLCCILHFMYPISRSLYRFSVPITSRAS